ncbi:MAG: hypothetical protein JW806_09000 [Sedimentisphaerales bacterium]|nr:hypothetical protein [Sedimentisphaerales bacterium]
MSIVSLITILAPQTAFYSVKFLKEIWIIFAASLMVWSFTIIIQNKRLLPAIFSIAAAVTLLFWVRFEYALMFLAAVPITLCFRYKCGFAEKLISVILMALITIIISSYQFNQLTQKAENMAGKYARMERGQRGNLETVEVLNKIYLSRGPLRLFNVPMSMLNPPPKNLHHVYTKENKLYEIERQVNIYQWWIPLPFLIIGAIRIISKRTELLALSLPYLITICTAAILIGGLEPNLLRYRDSLAPIAFIIIGLGIESFMIKSKPWKKLTILSVYSLFAMLVVYLYMRGF